jgi:hypothetical protein
VRGVGAAGVVTAALVGSACGFDDGSARSTLPPLPPPVNVPITAPPPPGRQAPTATTLAPGVTFASDDANPASVAQRFLTAAASGDAATADALRIADRDPDVFQWAQQMHDSTVAVAGDAAWGGPACPEPAGNLVSCTWLVNDPTTSLVLVQDGATWKVSHPLMVPADDGVDGVGTACVVGDRSVRLRGGPGTNWPRFEELAPNTCGITLYASVLEGPEGPWRLVDVNGAKGWIVDRVLRAQ